MEVALYVFAESGGVGLIEPCRLLICICNRFLYLKVEV